jgi:hypothetical protein
MSEVDPYGKAPGESGAKNDAGKPDCSLLLLFGRALSEIAAVGTVGAKKYSRGGWQFVPDGENRYTAAMLRHLWAEQQGMVDDDTGCYHAAQVAWNALARLELIMRRIENDEKGST